MLLLIKLAWRNLTRHYKKSLLLGSLIMVGMSILFMANSIFQGTNDGMEKTFIGSFTGDAAIGASSDSTFSLFGSEVPIVSEYESIPPLYTHEQVCDLLESIQEIESYTSIVSVPSRLSLGGRLNKNIVLFGVDPDSYFKVCSDVEIIEGNISDLSTHGVFINSVLAKELGAARGKPLEIGESISFSMTSGNSFRIRSAPFLGIHKYSGSTEALDRVVLGDLTTVRSLADYTLGYTVSDSETDSLIEIEEDSFDLDDLFSVNKDQTIDESEEINLEELELNLSDTSERDSLVVTDGGSWSFILIKYSKGVDSKFFRKLKSRFNNSLFEVDILSWREAAGNSALILFAVQSLFYLGLGFLGVGAVLVIMNALVFSVLERAGEIGTMRSIGASPDFIRGLFMMESLIITLGGAILGIFLGSFGSMIIKYSGIQLTNDLFISLFGGSSLKPVITFGGVVSHLFIAVVLGSLAWIYPVSLAMKIQPVTAMNKG